jgi:hypothetical protein
MYTIVGVQMKSFTTKDGKSVTGYNVWYTYERNGVDGVVTDRVFVSDRVCNRSNFTPHVGDVVTAFSYTRFGSLYQVVFPEYPFD